MNNEDLFSEADTSQYVHDIRPVESNARIPVVFITIMHIFGKKLGQNPYGGDVSIAIDDMNNERFYFELMGTEMETIYIPVSNKLSETWYSRSCKFRYSFVPCFWQQVASCFFTNFWRRSNQKASWRHYCFHQVGFFIRKNMPIFYYFGILFILYLENLKLATKRFKISLQ